MNIQEAFNLALKLHQAGKLAEAEAMYRQILAFQPEHADSLHLIGVIAFQSGRPDAAVESILQAVALNPNAAEYHLNLGTAYEAAGQTEPAIAEFKRALELKPDYAKAVSNLGVAHQKLGQMPEALAAFRRAVQLQPNLPEALNNLGNALGAIGELDEAVEMLNRALALRPNYPEAICNLAKSFQAAGLGDQAVEHYDRAATLAPENWAIASNRFFALHLNDHEGPSLLAEMKKWNERYADPLGRDQLPHANPPDPGKRLRIGYVSADFREHVVGWTLLPTFLRHDHEAFEIFCYSNVDIEDAMTGEFRAHADGWRSIRGLRDAQAAEMIRSDGIDILVDLSLHTAGNRLKLFALKPAPIQATYLGHLGTSGMSAMDYRLSDPYLDPPDGNIGSYSEKTIRLPHCYWCYQPRESAPDVSPAPSDASGFVTFGCLTKFAKVTPATLELWARILLAVPDSRLLLHCLEGSHRKAVLARFSGQGIASERIEFVGRQPWERYVETYQRIDVALDPFPWTGGITTCDSLWMGVPVITLGGKTVVGRGAGSILSSVGLAELIAETPEGYLNLARDWKKWIALRPTLRKRMSESPLMDAGQLAGDLEAAYRTMWQAWCARLSAKPINVNQSLEEAVRIHQAGQLDEAESLYRTILAVQPDQPDALNLLGIIANQRGRHEEAIELTRRAVTARPVEATFHFNLASALSFAQQTQEAIAAYRQAVDLQPNYSDAEIGLANALVADGQLGEAIALLRRIVESRPNDAAARTKLTFLLQFHPDYDSRAILAAAKKFNSVHAVPLAVSIRPWNVERSNHRRLRIGYVSPDFYEHVVAWHIVPLLQLHDRRKFEIFCYSTVACPDWMTDRIKGHAGQWREVSKLTDAQLAETIRQDRIDVLIDLSMYMAGGRPLLFARKPAPVQAVWLAYPGTTGLSAMDFRLTDPYLDPPGAFDADYSEASVRLPETFWCYDPDAASREKGDGSVPDVGPLPVETKGFVTFGNLGHFCKISDRTLALWSNVLRKVPQSHLLIQVAAGKAREVILEKLANLGVNSERVEFSERSPRWKYLREYHRIDIGLDTLPYNGHTTSLDSFWMGVPVITRIGETIVGRAGWSQLCNLKMTELAAKDDEQFVKVAADLANNLPRLGELRQTLRDRMRKSPLADWPKFTRHIEAAYVQMWTAQMATA
jgi:predicted O-linked N-acetylglucosamine transferase (SPINDLY family)